MNSLTSLYWGLAYEAVLEGEDMNSPTSFKRGWLKPMQPANNLSLMCDQLRTTAIAGFCLLVNTVKSQYEAINANDQCEQ